MKRITKKVLTLLMMLAFILQASLYVPPLTLTANADAYENGSEAEDYTVLAFTSDAHNMTTDSSADRLSAWIDHVEDEYNDIDAMGFCGDMADSAVSTSMYWELTRAVMDAAESRVGSVVYTTGNHEHDPGHYSASSTDPVQQKFKINMEGAEGDNFRIYCLGSESASQAYSSGQISALNAYLNSVGSDKPIFIITHFPLHYCPRTTGSGERITQNASGVINVLNRAAESGKKIVLLWGHNHTESDSYYDQIFKPGDTIRTSSGGAAAGINFFYCAAGCMSDYAYSNGSAYVQGKGLVITINSKDQLSFSYYDANGNNATEGGTFTEKDPVAVSGVTIIYKGAEIGDKVLTVEEGKTLSLTAEVEPEDATYKTVTWRSDDTSVVTVDNSGRVKGISAGSATITAVTNDGGFTATCRVTVIPYAAPGIGYVIKIGDYALSVNQSSDRLTNNSYYHYRGLEGVLYNSDTPQNEDILWQIEPTDGGYYIISQDGRYLNAYYHTTTNPTGCDSELKVDDTPDVWIFNGTLEDWVLSGSKLKSTNADKYLNHEIGEGKNLFDVRSEGNAQASSMIDPDNPAEERFVEADVFRDGGDFIVAVTKDGSSVYAVENISGTSSGDTGSRMFSNTGETKEYFPESGGERAYIITGNSGVVWNYGSGNRYLTNNSRYLSVSTGSPYVPRTSESGSAVSYDSSNKRFSISYSIDGGAASTYYLTNSSGTFGLNTDQASAVQVRLFEKSTVFNFKYVVQFVSNGVNYYSGKFALGESPVYEGETPTRAVDEQYAYVFSGWSCDGGMTVYGPNDELSPVNGPLTYVAQFERREKHHHSYGEPEYEWSRNDNGYECTAAAVCTECDEDTEGHILSEIVTASCEATIEPSCTEAGEGIYTAVFENELFADQTMEADVPATGHDWLAAAYEWSDDNSSVTATLVCGNDESHVETEKVNTTNEVTKEAACEENGETTYTAEFTNAVFEKQTKTVANINALGHDYQETVTAPTCTEQGYTTHICSRCGDTYVDTYVDANGHVWGEASYEWSDDNSNVTASHTCSVCRITEEETVDAGAEVTTAPGCTETGIRTYTSGAFSDEAFEVQTKTETIAATGHNPAEAVCENETAATCTKAGNHDEVIYCSVCGTEISRETIEDAALGHDWGETSYEWSDDYSSVTATRICSHDEGHVETEKVNTTNEVTKEAACEENGETTYTAEFTNAVFEKQTKTVANLNALGHDYQETVTAPTCTEQGYTTHTCLRCGNSYEDSYVAELGHDWGEASYEWSDDNSSVTAIRICSRDDGHVETETVGVTSAVTTAPGCTETGIRTYTSGVFANEAFEVQTKTETIAATGHNPAEAVRENETAATCTEAGSHDEVIYCSVCGTEISRKTIEDAALGHDYQETVTAPTCTEKGYTTHTCTRCGGAYVDTYVDAAGHKWGAASYTWSKDKSSVTASHKCSVCGETETETAKATSKVTTAATCEKTGIRTYTSAAFRNAAFMVQTTTETIPALGHDYKAVVTQPTCTEKGYTTHTCTRCGGAYVDTYVDAAGHKWGAASYTWSKDKSSVTASHKCSVCGETETETAKATSKVTTAATCEKTGIRTYTSAAFRNAAFMVQTTTETIPATGHNWGKVTYTWSKDRTSVTASHICGNDRTHVESESVGTTNEVVREATETTPGVRRYISETFSNEAFKTVTEEEEIPPYGYEVSYEWAADNSKVTATAVPYDVNAETVTETAEATGKVTRDATCEENGEITFTVTFKSKEFAEQTKAEVIPAKGHSEEVIEGKDATCTEPGLTDGRKCSVCGEILEEQEEIPAKGHDFDEWVVIKEAGLGRDGEKCRTCKVCGEKETEVIEKRLFNDVKDPAAWFYDYVYDIANTENKHGTALMSGYADGSGNFGPADPLTRQDFACILYRLADEPAVKNVRNPYPDTVPGSYYYRSVLWAKQESVIRGYEDGRYGVGDQITREQVATILYRYAKDYLGMNVKAVMGKGNLKKFKDEKSVNAFAYDALTWANGAGIVKGKDNGAKIDPQGNAARAEIGAMILRFIKYVDQQ